MLTRGLLVPESPTSHSQVISNGKCVCGSCGACGGGGTQSHLVNGPFITSWRTCQGWVSWVTAFHSQVYNPFGLGFPGTVWSRWDIQGQSTCYCQEILLTYSLLFHFSGVFSFLITWPVEPQVPPLAFQNPVYLQLLFLAVFWQC